MLDFSLRKQLGDFQLDLSLTAGNECLVLLAPSGGGKTLTLNLLSGFVRPDEGHIAANGAVLYDSGKNIFMPIRKRRIGYIFQDYALFPHMTVRENIAYGMRRGEKTDASVANLMEQFQLTGKAEARPGQLSGGQKQRTAIARAIASEPHIILFDEPLSAVDVQLKTALLKEIRETLRRFAVPALYVTHNFQDARIIGDKIAVMNDGKLVEYGSVNDIFTTPEKTFTARFLGIPNILPCRLESRSGPEWTAIAGERIRFTVSPDARITSDSFMLCVNDTDVRLKVSDSARPNTLQAEIEELTLSERNYHAVLRVMHGGGPVPDFVLHMSIDELNGNKYGLQRGKRIEVYIRPERCILCTA